MNDLSILERRVAASMKAARTRARRRQAAGIASTCSRCRGPRDTRGCYCKKCRAAYMRLWRKRNWREVSCGTLGFSA